MPNLLTLGLAIPKLQGASVAGSAVPDTPTTPTQDDGLFWGAVRLEWGSVYLAWGS